MGFYLALSTSFPIICNNSPNQLKRGRKLEYWILIITADVQSKYIYIIISFFIMEG